MDVLSCPFAMMAQRERKSGSKKFLVIEGGCGKGSQQRRVF
jgi:hypothetical protein